MRSLNTDWENPISAKKFATRKSKPVEVLAFFLDFLSKITITYLKRKKVYKMRRIKKFLFGLILATFTTFVLASCNFNAILEEMKGMLDGVKDIISEKTPHHEEEKNQEIKSDNAVEGVVYEEFQMHFLELGNKYTGDSTYIKVGDIDILIDAGSKKDSASTIKKYIDKYCSDNKLEYVIATHAHQDHIAGFIGNSNNGQKQGIFYQYKIDTLIDFSLSNSTSNLYEEYLEAREYLISNGTVHYTADECFNNKNGASRIFKLTDDIEMEILYNYYYFNESADENNYSVCTMFNYKNEKYFMQTGDLELEGEEKMVEYYDGSTKEKTLPKVTLFKAGHHGSKTSSNECLLSIIQPDICTICCCAGGSEYTSNYNNVFPTQEFINRIAKYTDQVYVTSFFDEKDLVFKSLNGNIIISSNGSNVAVAASNNLIKLKDTEWFNEIVYIDDKNNICSGTKKEDFFTKDTEGVKAVPRRIWPS